MFFRLTFLFEKILFFLRLNKLTFFCQKLV
jgi:hypothetical protein